MEGIRLNEAMHESYLQLWRGRVMECRNSGKPIAVWCEEQGIVVFDLVQVSSLTLSRRQHGFYEGKYMH